MSMLLLQLPAYWLGFPISKQVSIKLPLNCKINHSKRGSGHFFERLDVKKLPEPLKDREAWRSAFQGGAACFLVFEIPPMPPTLKDQVLYNCVYIQTP